MSIVPGPEAGQPSGRRAQVTRPSGTSAALAVASLAGSFLVANVQLPFAGPMSTVRIVLGLLNAMVIPGYLVIAAIYPQPRSLAPLLRWVLILAVSALFDVTLALGFSAVGVRLNERNLALGALAVLLPVGAAAFVRRAPPADLQNAARRKRTAPSGLWPYPAALLAVFFTVLALLAPGYSRSSPSLYLTVGRGVLPPGLPIGHPARAVEVHVDNPGAKGATFLLKEFGAGSRTPRMTRIALAPRGSWTHGFALPAGHTGGGRVVFRLTEVGDSAFHRAVWLTV